MFLFAKIAWHYVCQEGTTKTRIFVRTICFGQKGFWAKTAQTRNNSKNGGFSGDLPKTKNDIFLEKGVFGVCEKVVFTNCVFEKLCSSESIIFIVFSTKHSSCSKKICRQKEINEK